MYVNCKQSIVYLAVFTVAIFILIISQQSEDEPMKLVCYYRFDDNSQSTSSKMRSNDFGILRLLDINGSICTHVTLGFASISQGEITLDNEGQLGDVPLLKKKFPHLKVLLSLGGGGNSANFHEAFLNRDTRSHFIDSTVRLLHKYSLDGLDVDWEFPGWSKYDSDAKTFPLLLAQMRQAFDTVEPKLLLSVAVSASYSVIKVSYRNVQLIHTSVDWINLMSYDFHSYSRFFPFVEHNSPLSARSEEKGFFATLNTKWSAWFWSDYLGVPKKKLIIGIPFYTHNYILADRDFTKPGSLAVAEAPEMSYSQVCSLLRNCSNCAFFDEEAKVPYAVFDSQWISYEDTRSILLKGKWAKENGFGGCMTFDLNTDDFSYACSSEKQFLLQQTLYDCLRSS